MNRRTAIGVASEVEATAAIAAATLFVLTVLVSMGVQVSGWVLAGLTVWFLVLGVTARVVRARMARRIDVSVEVSDETDGK